MLIHFDHLIRISLMRNGFSKTYGNKFILYNTFQKSHKSSIINITYKYYLTTAVLNIL